MSLFHEGLADCISRCDARGFLRSPEEVQRYLESRNLERRLTKELFEECGKRMNREKLSFEEIQLRLVEVFGHERIARFLGTAR